MSEHTTQVYCRNHHGDGPYQARCSCGWRGEFRPDSSTGDDLAREDAEKHEYEEGMFAFLARQNERAIRDSANGGTPSGD